MTTIQTITAMQAARTDELLPLYRQFTGNLMATAEELFAFLITPTPERTLFLSTKCAHTVSMIDTIVLSTYTAL